MFTLEITESAEADLDQITENMGRDPKKSYNFVCESRDFVNYCSFGGMIRFRPRHNLENQSNHIFIWSRGA